MKKRILGILTAMVLCLILLPTAALAVTDEGDYWTDVLIPWNQSLDGDILDSRGTLSSAAYVSDNGIYEIWAGDNVLQLQAYKETDDMSVIHYAFYEKPTTITTNTEAVRFRLHVVDETHITMQCIGNAAPYYNQTLYIIPVNDHSIEGKYLGWNSLTDVFLSDEPVLIELKNTDLKCVSTDSRLFYTGKPKFRKMQETLSVKKEQTFTYDGSVKLPVVTGTNNDPQRTSEVNYGLDGTDTWYTKYKATEDVGFQKNVGSYQAYIQVKRQKITASGVSGQDTFVFGPITVNIVKQAQITRDAAAIAGLTHNGQMQELVSPASGTGGTVKYSQDNINWSTDIPTAKDAGTYIVYYKVFGGTINDGTADVSISDSVTKSVSVTIARQALKVTKDEVKQNLNKFFTGRKLSPPCMKTGETGTTSKIIPADAITYGGDYLKSAVGTYTATVQPSFNYTWKDGSTDSVSLEWKITSRSINLTGVTAQSRPYEAGNLNVNVTWDGTVKPINIDDDAQNALNEALSSGKFTITVDPTGVMKDDTVGTQKQVLVKAYLTGEPEYVDGIKLSYSDSTNQQIKTYVDITNPRYHLIAPTAAEGLTYDPNDTTPKALLTTDASCQEAGTVEGITYEYSLDKTNWSAAIPTASAAGTYDVYYRANKTTGYAETVCDTPVQVTIKPYEITPPTDADLAAAAAYNGSEQTAELNESYAYRDKVEFTAGQKQTNAGTHSVTLSLTDSNYTWPNAQTTRTLNWTIAPNPVTAKVTVTTKDYDGTTIATVSAVVTTTEGLIGDDAITISGLIGTFGNVNAGTNIPVTVNADSMSITGTDSGNYAVTIPESTTGNITPKTIGIDWSNTTLTYNGNEQVPTATATGLVSGDTCTITVTGGQTNVGTDYTATAASVSNSNYQLPTENTKTFSITPKPLTVTGLTAVNRVYAADNITVELSGGELSGIVSGDEGQVTAAMPTEGTIEDANAGANKAVDFGTITLSGTKAGNYTLTQPTVTVNISQADPDVGEVSYSGGTIYTTTELNNISLSRDGTTAGTLKLTAGQTMTAGTANYGWTFTPNESTNYKTVTGTISLTVEADTLSGISIGDTVPSTKSYKYGETFQTDGLTVTATYASGLTKNVTAEVTFGALSVGQTEITLSYGGKTCTVSGLTVDKADARTLSDISVSQKYTVTTQQSKEIGRAGMPADAGTLTYAKGTEETVPCVSSWSVDSTGKVTYTLSDDAANGTVSDDAVVATVTLPVVISSTNYADSTVKVVITLTDKDVPTATANDITVTYTGSAVPVTAITGTASVAGTWSFKAAAPVNVADSSESVAVMFTPADEETYATVEDIIKVTINKTTPTGTPAYTAITTSGKALADAALAVGGITPAGTIAWNDSPETSVAANTAYGWTFTPTDTDNYNNLTGSITPYVVSYSGGGSSGGGGSSSSSGTTTKNPDGSTTTTTTDKTTGTVTETTKNTDGSTTTVETKKDGTVTETVKTTDGTTGTVTTDKDGNVTEAKAVISSTAAKEAGKTGGAVTLPVEVPAAKSTGDAPAVEITLSKSSGSVKVEIPVEKATPGTVAVIVKADGTEEIVSTSRVTENGVSLSLTGSTTVKVFDNAKSFNDVPVSNVFYNEISSLSARNIMIGVSSEKFNLNGSVTLDQIANVAGRITGAVDVKDFNSGITWGKTNGLKSGSASATRGDVLKALYIAAGSPTVTDTSILAQFKDSVPEDLKAIAAWAAQNGILKGNIDSKGILTANLNTNVTRGQACALAGRTLNTIG